MAKKKVEEAVEVVEVEEVVEEQKTVTVICGALNVRKRPAMNADVVTIVHQGDVLEVIEERGSWTKTSLGYVKSEFVS